jgi:hypothetical protein
MPDREPPSRLDPKPGIFRRLSLDHAIRTR